MKKLALALVLFISNVSFVMSMDKFKEDLMKVQEEHKKQIYAQQAQEDFKKNMKKAYEEFVTDVHNFVEHNAKEEELKNPSTIDELPEVETDSTKEAHENTYLSEWKIFKNRFNTSKQRWEKDFDLERVESVKREVSNLEIPPHINQFYTETLILKSILNSDIPSNPLFQKSTLDSFKTFQQKMIEDLDIFLSDVKDVREEIKSLKKTLSL